MSNQALLAHGCHVPAHMRGYPEVLPGETFRADVGGLWTLSEAERFSPLCRTPEDVELLKQVLASFCDSYLQGACIFVARRPGRRYEAALFLRRTAPYYLEVKQWGGSLRHEQTMIRWKARWDYVDPAQYDIGRAPDNTTTMVSPA